MRGNAAHFIALSSRPHPSLPACPLWVPDLEPTTSRACSHNAAPPCSLRAPPSPAPCSKYILILLPPARPSNTRHAYCISSPNPSPFVCVQTVRSERTWYRHFSGCPMTGVLDLVLTHFPVMYHCEHSHLPGHLLVFSKATHKTNMVITNAKDEIALFLGKSIAGQD